MRTETQPTSTFREPSVKRGWVPTRNLRGTVLVTSRYLLGTFQVTAGYLPGVPSRGTFQGYLPGVPSRGTFHVLPGSFQEETVKRLFFWLPYGGMLADGAAHLAESRTGTIPPLERNVCGHFLHSSGARARSLGKQRAIATTACAPVYHIAIYLSMYMYTY